MNQNDRERFSDILLAAGEIFGREISAPAMEITFKALEEFSIDQVEAAYSRAIKELRWYPRPVEIIDMIVGGGKLEDRAEVEAATTLRAIKRFGAYESVVFTDPVSAAVVNLGFGGWIRLCSDLKAEGEKWFLKDFVRMYKSYSRLGVKETLHLSGIIEAENVAAGFTDQAPAPKKVEYDYKEPKKLSHTTKT